jgi:RHS repeat-associated protein
VTELSSTGAWNRGEIFASGRHLATYVNSTTYFDHADWLGTERARSDMTGANCQTITNVTFGDGQSLSGTGSNCADANPLHFTGQQWDSESGLHYFRARHYSTQFGRFMSPDPTGIFLGNLNDPQSLNLYAYVRNNSPSMTDPSGLCDGFVSIGTCDGDIGINIGIGWGWGRGGNWDWGGGPDGPQNFPANIGPNPNPGGSWSQCGFLYGSVCGLDPYPGGFVPPDLVDIAVDAFATPNRVPTENPPPRSNRCTAEPLRIRLRITTQFGDRDPSHPLAHTGRDYAAPIGTPVYAPENGVVRYAGPMGTAGNAVIVQSHAVNTYLFHLSRVLAESGQNVSAGAPVAYTGNTGHSTGPHLHFEQTTPGPIILNPALRRPNTIEPCW